MLKLDTCDPHSYSVAELKSTTRLTEEKKNKNLLNLKQFLFWDKNLLPSIRDDRSEVFISTRCEEASYENQQIFASFI